MMRNALIILILTPLLTCAQGSAERILSNAIFIKDSLSMGGGIARNEYNFPVIDAKTLREYEHFCVVEPSEHSQKTIFHHWEVPIRVYLDKSLPGYLKRDFRKFMELFTGIENLAIVEAGSVGEANYKVMATGEILKMSATHGKSFYDGTTYMMLADDFGNCNSARLMINFTQVSDKVEQKKKLRQFFFNSLGRFYFLSPTESPEKSLFSEKYELQDALSEFDLRLLKCHYLLINKNVLDAEKFGRLARLYKKLPDEKKTGRFVKLNL